MKRARLHLPMAALLTLAWLLLANSVSWRELLAGALFAVVLAHLTASFQPAPLRVRRPELLLRYLLRLLMDIVRAGLNVAQRVLGPPASLHPAFIHVPIDLRCDTAIAILTSTISLTPGTVVVHVSHDRRWLLVHALDAPEPAAVVNAIKCRYESLLKRVFE